VDQRELAIAARDRLQVLVGSGYGINWLVATMDTIRRWNVILANGQDAGNVLLQEGLASSLTRFPAFDLN
jgi:hypothetical protein